jgi:hypothetical protein
MSFRFRGRQSIWSFNLLSPHGANVALAPPPDDPVAQLWISRYSHANLSIFIMTSHFCELESEWPQKKKWRW